MKSLKTLFIIFGLFIQTCLSANVETDKYDSNFDENTKTVTKREYYAPEYKHDQYSYPAYRFEYGVHDPHTGDIKKQYEERDGDTVRGYYSLVEPDGSIRLVEYTADSKNGFQATVKKIGHSHHPTTVTHHLNTANGHHNGDNAGYAPDYHGGQHYGGHHFGVQHYGGEHERPSIQPIYNNRYEPPAYSNHYEQPQPVLPVYANHYEPRPAPPAYNGHHVFNNNYYHQHAPQNVYHHEPPVVPGHNHFQQPPSLPSYNHYEPSHVAPVHYEPSAHPETADYEHEAPALFAGGLPTIHGDYGSASTEEYYPAPLQFPVVSNVKNFGWADKDDDRQHRISLNDYQFPATRDGDEHHVGVTKNGPVDRPEYLRKYFEPEHRDHADVNSYFDESDDDSKK